MTDHLSSSLGPTSPSLCPTSPSLCPTSPSLCPTSPSLCPTSPSLCSTSPSLCPTSPPRTPSQSIRPTRSVMVVLISTIQLTNTLALCISCALLGTPHSCLHTLCFWFIPHSSPLHSSIARCDDCHHYSHPCASSVLRSDTPYTLALTHCCWLLPHGLRLHSSLAGGDDCRCGRQRRSEAS
jgi:hypothetical protein